MNSYNPFIARLTRKRRPSRPLSTQAQREQFIADRIELPVLQADSHGDITYANRFFCQFFAIQPEQLLRLSLFDIDNEIGQDDWPGIWKSLQHNGRAQTDSSLVHGNGHNVTASLVFHLYRDHSGDYAFIFVHPHAAESAEEDDCEGLHHPVTGLPRRKLLLSRLAQVTTHAGDAPGKVLVLSVALDHFELIRDIAGSSGSNNVLRTIARRLAEFTDSKDTIAHVEDDEFAVVRVQFSDDTDVSTFGKRLMAALSEAIRIAGHDFHVTACVGAAVYPDDGSDHQSIYHSAHSSLHLARSSGRGMFCRAGAAPDAARAGTD